MAHKVEAEIGKKKLVIETGKLAKQANGAVTVSYGDTVVLTTVVGRDIPEEEEFNFFPLMVEYREMTYAAGKIPGGFFKREGRPSQKEIVTSRMIDRPIRPLFSEGHSGRPRQEVQICSIALSADEENDPDILGIIGGSAALAVSDIPFPDPIGAVRIGRKEGEFIVNPTYTEVEEGDLDLVICGWENGLCMVEGSGKEVPEEVILEALQMGEKFCGKASFLIKELVKKAGKTKREVKNCAPLPEGLEDKIAKVAAEKVKQAYREQVTKEERKELIAEVEKEVAAKFGEEYSESVIQQILEKLENKLFREKILKERVRLDGRSESEIRPISCEVGILPRTHGSAVFTRGETQSLVTTTLGSTEDEQRMDELRGESSKNFMLHYNFPPFSVGEVKPIRGPGRREIGHGALAEKALKPVMTQGDDFPYTVRLVSEILESNGSSSMASVCGSSLSVMDAGVPIKRAVAGVALGLLKEGDEYAILTDILGFEDKFGDMDLKIAGTAQGITAMQMDLKIKEVGIDILEEAFSRSKQARIHILEIMNETISAPRESISSYAPHIAVVSIPREKIGDLIGPGGRNIRSIISATGAKIEIDDEENKVTIAAPNKESQEKAIELVKESTTEAEIGKAYKGKVSRITSFGAFVKISPNQEGLVHISELDSDFVKNVEDVVKVGDEILVKVIKIDELGRINLSKKAATNSSN